MIYVQFRRNTRESSSCHLSWSNTFIFFDLTRRPYAWAHHRDSPRARYEIATHVRKTKYNHIVITCYYYYLSELPFCRVPAEERGECGQQEHDNDEQDQLGPVQEHAALAVVLDLVERGHSVRYVVAPVPGL